MKKIWNWLKKFFVDIEQHVDAVAISITQHVKTALDNGELNFIASIVDGLLHTGLAAEAVGVIKLQLPKILAVELAIQGLPTNPTEEDILAFEQRVLDAFGIHNQKSKLYTVLAAQLYGEVKTLLNQNNGATFAQWVKAVEDAYHFYQEDKLAFGENE